MSAFRATRTLLKRVPESPHTYHYQEGQTPFWRKARDILSLNPSRAALIIQNRYPQPASRPEKPSAMPSKDNAANMYYHRDYRRKFPQTDVITQYYLTELLLAEPNEDGTKRYVAVNSPSLPSPESGESTSTALTRPEDLHSPTAFTEVLNQVQSEPKNVYSASNMPPRFPSTKPQHILKIQKNAIPRGRWDYFPV